MKPRARKRWVWGVALVVLLVPIYIVGFFIDIYVGNRKNEQAWERHRKSYVPMSSVVEAAEWRGFVRYFDKDQIIRTKYGEDAPPFGYQDSAGRVVIPATFSLCAPSFSEGVAWAFTQDGRGVCIDPTGKTLFEVEAIAISNFSSGLARIRVRGKDDRTLDGFIDSTGAVAIPPRYRDASDFVGQYALVTEWHAVSSLLERFVDTTGVPLKMPFGYRKRIIDQRGERVTPTDLHNR